MSAPGGLLPGGGGDCLLPGGGVSVGLSLVISSPEPDIIEPQIGTSAQKHEDVF